MVVRRGREAVTVGEVTDLWPRVSPGHWELLVVPLLNFLLNLAIYLIFSS